MRSLFQTSTMCSNVAAFFFFILTLQHANCVTRLEIRSQFQPALLSLRDLANAKYLEADREYKFLLAQKKKYQTKIRMSTHTQINNMRRVVATAKKTYPKAGTCLKDQEIAVSRLSTNFFNNCFSDMNISALNLSKEQFLILARMAASTVRYCQYLNLLETQLESYAECLSKKVQELNREINIAESRYQKTRNATLRNGIQCLIGGSGDILGQIRVIRYQIRKCGWCKIVVR